MLPKHLLVDALYCSMRYLLIDAFSASSPSDQVAVSLSQGAAKILRHRGPFVRLAARREAGLQYYSTSKSVHLRLVHSVGRGEGLFHDHALHRCPSIACRSVEITADARITYAKLTPSSPAAGAPHRPYFSAVRMAAGPPFILTCWPVSRSVEPSQASPAG